MLRRELRHPVRRDRARQRILFGRKHLGVAVDRGAAREDEPVDAYLAQRFEQTLRSEDVVAQVAVEVMAPARPDRGLAGEVEDDPRAVQQLVQVDVDEVGLVQREVAVHARDLEVSLLATAVVVVAERIDRDHLVPVREQALAQVRPDETGGAGDRNPCGTVEHDCQECGQAGALCNSHLS